MKRRAPQYSDEEKAILRRLYRAGTKQELLDALPGRTWKGIGLQAFHLHLKRARIVAAAWSAEEEAQLRAHYPSKGTKHVASLINRTQDAVSQRAILLGLRAECRQPQPRDYTQAEQAVLRQLYPAASQAELLTALPTRNWKSIQSMAVRLKIRRQAQPAHCWSAEHDEMLRQHYPGQGAAYVGGLTGRSSEQVRNRAMRLGITTTFRPGRPPKSDEAQKREARLAKLLKAKKPKKKKAAKKKPVAAKPKAAPRPAPTPPPVKRSPATPNLNAQAARQQAKKAEAAKPKEFVTAAQVQALSANHPARWAWTRAAYNGPAAATEAFHQAMNELKQAA